MKKYETRVREIAEEIAEQLYLEDIPPVEYDDNNVMAFSHYEEKDFLVDYQMTAARIAVKHMAEEFASGFNYNYDFTDDPEFGPDIIKGQIERGLIPSPEQPEKGAGEV